MLKSERILAFTADQVCALTQNSKSQLAYWDKTGFFRPRIIDERKGSPFRKAYSFRDLVGLRTISKLRNENGVPLQKLRKIGEYLRRNYDQPWSSLRFEFSGNGRVYFQEPGAKLAFEAEAPGQGDGLIIELKDIAQEVDRCIIHFKRPRGHVSKNRYIVRNDPVVTGTRIRTEAIWNYHVAKYSNAEIKAEFPSLTDRDIQAAIRFERVRDKSRNAA